MRLLLDLRAASAALILIDNQETLGGVVKRRLKILDFLVFFCYYIRAFKIKNGLIGHIVQFPQYAFSFYAKNRAKRTKYGAFRVVTLTTAISCANIRPYQLTWCDNLASRKEGRRRKKQ